MQAPVILAKDTLAYQCSQRPGVLRLDKSHIPVPVAVGRVNDFLANTTVHIGGYVETPQSHPERDALVFYLMNHAVSLIRRKHHPLESVCQDTLNFLDMYHDILALKSARMFYYLLLICTRESRHVIDSAHSPLFMKFVNTMKQGTGCVEFHSTIRGHSSMGAAGVFQNNPPKVMLGPYTNFMYEVFMQGKFKSGFGGPAWGAVALVLRDFVSGTISAEIMMDTAFTLCHNNGPIFNKGMLFTAYTKHIYEILDVQRSGQIPQMVRGGETPHYQHGEISKAYKAASHLLGADLTPLPYVDWFMVEELGALHDVSQQQQKQKANHGLPKNHAAFINAQKFKQQAEEQKEKEAQAGVLFVTPSVKLKKFKKVRK